MTTPPAYAFAERAIDDGAEVDVVDMALAAMPSWLEFRDIPPFSTVHPARGRWLNRLSMRACMRATLEREIADRWRLTLKGPTDEPDFRTAAST